jgi:hypothetical protein
LILNCLKIKNGRKTANHRTDEKNVSAEAPGQNILLKMTATTIIIETSAFINTLSSFSPDLRSCIASKGV